MQGSKKVNGVGWFPTNKNYKAGVLVIAFMQMINIKKK